MRQKPFIFIAVFVGLCACNRPLDDNRFAGYAKLVKEVDFKSFIGRYELDTNTCSKVYHAYKLGFKTTFFQISKNEKYAAYQIPMDAFSVSIEDTKLPKADISGTWSLNKNQRGNLALGLDIDKASKEVHSGNLEAELFKKGNRYIIVLNLGDLDEGKSLNFIKKD